jgi:catechol 2,3-dioxygenase-like lactoylglutathione lyase family enzyme
MAAMMRFPLVCRPEDDKIIVYGRPSSHRPACATKETLTIIRNALVPELAVSDWQKSRAFYCDLIGFHVVYERPEEGFAYLALGDAQLMIDQIGATRTFVSGNASLEPPFGRGMNLQLAVPSLQPILFRLERALIGLVLEPEEKWYRRGTVEVGNRQFIVADPDGYLIRPFESLGERAFRFG